MLDPVSTAVLTMELQRGVCGDLAALPDLRDAVAAIDLPRRAGRICAAARAAGATVVHCTAAFRPDRRGSVSNARILVAAAERNGDRLDRGQPGTELIPELSAEPPSRVSFEIEPQGDGGLCQLRIRHDRFEPGSQVYEQVRGGWSAIICSLKSLLETGEPLALAGNETDRETDRETEVENP